MPDPDDDDDYDDYDDDEEGAFDKPTVKTHVNEVRRRQRRSAPVFGSQTPRTAPQHAGAATCPSVDRPSRTTRDHSDAKPPAFAPALDAANFRSFQHHARVRRGQRGCSRAAPRDGAVVSWPHTAGPTAALPLEAGACTPDGPVSVVEERPRHDSTDHPRSTVCGAVTDSKAQIRETSFFASRLFVRAQV